MQKRRILRSDDRIMRSGRKIMSGVSSEEPRADKSGPVWDEKTGERIPGVWTSKSGKKYESRISDPIKQKYVSLGSFDTIQEASDAYNAKKRELDKAVRDSEIEDENDDVEVVHAQFQTQTGPNNNNSSRDLRKEIVSVKSSKFNGGGAMGFMVPDSTGVGKAFLPVIDNKGFLIGKFSQGDLSALDAWLSFPRDLDTDEVESFEVESSHVPTQDHGPETESSHVITSESDVPTQSKQVTTCLDSVEVDARTSEETDVPTQSKQVTTDTLVTCLDSVEVDARPSRKRKETVPDSPKPEKKKKKAAPSAKDALSGTFYDDDCQSRWETVSQRKILPERPSDLGAFKESGFTEFLSYLGFTTAATVYEDYNKDLVQEFYANLMGGNLDPNSEWYNSVYIRGKVVRFSGEMINKLLGRPTPEDFETVYSDDFSVTDDQILSEITGAIQSQWPAHANALTSSLTTRYFCLHQLAVNCWIPSLNTTVVNRDMAKLLYCIGTKTPMNLGLLIQERIVMQAATLREMNSLPHPCVISALMEEEKVKVKTTDLVVSTVPIKPNKRTFSLRIVKDLPWTTAAASTSTERVKKAKILAIDAKTAALRAQMEALRVQIAALEAERAQLVNAEDNEA